MVLCSVAEVRAIVSSETVTDNEVSGIISHASNIISLQTGASTDASDNLKLKLACTHLSAAFVIFKARETGELATQLVMKGQSQSNSVVDIIEYHKNLSNNFISQYLGTSFKILYGRVGPRTVNSEAVHD